MSLLKNFQRKEQTQTLAGGVGGKNENTFDRKKILRVVLFVIYVAAIFVPAYYFYSKYQAAQQMLTTGKADPSVVEATALVTKISKIVELPQGETPTVATISDKDKLKDNPFFARAENGDKVLIYTNARKAYLYRPSTGKLIDIAPIDLTGQSNQQTQQSSTAK